MIYLRACKTSDLNHVQKLAKSWSNEIGFIPPEAYRHYRGLGSIVVAHHAGDLIGFLVGTFSIRRAPAAAQVYQLCVDKTYQGMKCGRMLLEAFERESLKLDAKGMTANVAETLPSLGFWLHMGYDNLQFRGAKNARNRRVCMMYKEFEANALEDPWARPGVFRPGGDTRIQQILDLATAGDATE